MIRVVFREDTDTEPYKKSSIFLWQGQSKVHPYFIGLPKDQTIEEASELHGKMSSRLPIRTNEPYICGISTFNPATDVLSRTISGVTMSDIQQEILGF